MTSSKGDERIFDALLDYLRRARGFDFTGYKRSSLQRRVTKRMHSQQIYTYGDYLDYLEVHPEEFPELFNTILINVTALFRDMSAWEHLWQQVLPQLLEEKPPDEPIRAWSAGCASGEEAYTLAMILADLLGPEQFRKRVKIYATDVDNEALAQARQAIYSARSLEPVPEAMRDRYFDSVGHNYVCRADLRRAVIFGRHDLVQDAPISRLDLLVCRNTLMYFNAEIQARILARFHFALKEGGALFLGKAEMLLTHTHLFTPLNLQHRVFRKVPKVNFRDRLLVLAQSGDEEAESSMNFHVRLRDAALNAIPLAQLIVDHQGKLVMASPPARTMFGINSQEVGRPFQDLEVSYRPLELRSPIEQVCRDRHSLIIADVVRILLDREAQYFDVHITPLQDDNTDLLGVSITFTDVTRYHSLQSELNRSSQELETANEELQSSNEELETTNEELQSTNEELETTNEELQSTNEELETMNEELQSTNEELQTINDELRVRTGDLDQANAFLHSILTSLQKAVIVVNQQFNILGWNTEAENLWGLRAAEVEGRSLLSLDIGLPVGELHDPIRQILLHQTDSLQEISIAARNRRGQSIQCQTSLSLLIGPEGDREGVILLMEEVET